MTNAPADPGPEPEAPREESVVGRIVLALVALLGPPVAAGGLGIVAMMILVMAADGGMKDRAAAESYLQGVIVSLGVAACCGVPLSLGVLITAARKPLLVVGVLMGGAGALGAVVSAGLYLNAALG